MAVFSFLKKITGSVLDAYPELRDARTWISMWRLDYAWN